MREEHENQPVPAGEDKELICRFRSGDNQAFDRLVLKHKDRIHSLCFRLLGDMEEANDAAQDTFLKAYQGLRHFRFEAAFSTWLFRICVNTCKNRLSSSFFRKRKKTLSMTDLPGSVLEKIRGSSMPADELEKKQRAELIQRAINTLPQKQKTAVVLKDVEGLRYEEISAITGLKLGTVKSTLARARLTLRDKLRGVILG